MRRKFLLSHLLISQFSSLIPQFTKNNGGKLWVAIHKLVLQQDNSTDFPLEKENFILLSVSIVIHSHRISLLRIDGKTFSIFQSAFGIDIEQRGIYHLEIFSPSFNDVNDEIGSLGRIFYQQISASSFSQLKTTWQTHSHAQKSSVFLLMSLTSPRFTCFPLEQIFVHNFWMLENGHGAANSQTQRNKKLWTS